MKKIAFRWLPSFLSSLFALPASAHVKWFLGKNQAELLKQPKPDLFSQPSAANLIPTLFAWLIVLFSVHLAKRFESWKTNKKLLDFAQKYEPAINLFVALCLSSQLIYCSLTSTLFAPNFIVCDHCPKWLLPLEFVSGCGLLLGLCSRFSALVMLSLLIFTFVKHTVANCLDLIPLYGLSIYFLCAGRNRYSLDFLLNPATLPKSSYVSTAHLFLRSFAGIGFMFLGFDEKLINPQLALELLNHYPSLNFMVKFGMGNDMFVLCAGLSEVVIGAILLLGTFPRLAVVLISGLFIMTSCIFGTAELFGHAPYYGMLVSIFLRGAGDVQPSTVIRSAQSKLFDGFAALSWRLNSRMRDRIP